MRAVIQRVDSANVRINEQVHSKIERGFLIYLGIEHADEQDDAKWLVDKISKLRIFSDSEGKMNLSIQDINGSILVISQFTLHAKTKKGNRPSFINAARPENAIPLYKSFIEHMEQQVTTVQSGIFGAEMYISSINNGPVTILIDSKNRE